MPDEEQPIRLHYVGNGQYVPGVPVTDLELEDDTLAVELITTGLYELVPQAVEQPQEGEVDAEH